MPDSEWSAQHATSYGDQLLTGRSVRLRGLRDEDLPQLVRWWQDPRLGALQMSSVIPPSEAAARELFTRWSANQDTGAGFSIETLPTGDEPATLLGHLTMFKRAIHLSAPGVAFFDGHGQPGTELPRG